MKHYLKKRRDLQRKLREENKVTYIRKHRIHYYSPRYGKVVVVPEGYPSDGATGAIDIYSRSWWIHDYLKQYERWNDGTRCTNEQASWVIYDVLVEEGRFIRARTWFISTLFYGETIGKWFN